MSPAVDQAWVAFHATVERRIEDIRCAATSMRIGRQPRDPARVQALLDELRALTTTLHRATGRVAVEDATADAAAFIQTAQQHVHRLWTMCTGLQGYR